MLESGIVFLSLLFKFGSTFRINLPLSNFLVCSVFYLLFTMARCNSDLGEICEFFRSKVMVSTINPNQIFCYSLIFFLDVELLSRKK